MAKNTKKPNISIINEREMQLYKMEHNVNRSKNVAIYCRVSTKYHVQLGSIGSQISRLIEVILKKSDFLLYDIYVDLESGKGIKNRKNFNRMIEDCNNGKIDIIITKSVSRFARNTLDALKIARELKSKNIGILFVNENIDTLNEDSELMLSFVGSFVQDESYNKSQNIKLGLKQAIKTGKGKILDRKCYGYTNDKNGKLVPFEEEAKVVRKIYELYIKGYSILKIIDYLKENNIKTGRGKDEWSKRSVEQILYNEKYVGDVRLNKTYATDFPDTRRLINRGEKEAYYIKEHHAPIIDRETFDKVQNLRIERSNMEYNEYNMPIERKKTRYVSKKNDT